MENSIKIKEKNKQKMWIIWTMMSKYLHHLLKKKTLKSIQYSMKIDKLNIENT